MLFAAAIGETLDATLLTAEAGDPPPDVGRRPELHPPPHTGGAFMDDTYIWGESPEQVQKVLAELETRFSPPATQNQRQKDPDHQQRRRRYPAIFNWRGPAQKALLQAANTCQLLQIRTMISGTRPSGEAWDSWHVRTMRKARLALHHAKGERWSTHAS